jgi:hypothetical protein
VGTVSAVDWVRPEPREADSCWVETGIEFEVRCHFGDFGRRTRWNTQRTLQAVGTGALWGRPAGVERWSTVAADARWMLYPWNIQLSDRAAQAAAIGFGAL